MRSEIARPAWRSSRRCAVLAAAAVASVVLAGSIRGTATTEGAAVVHAAQPARASLPPADDRQWIEMRNVDLHLGERGVMRLRELRGEVLSATPGAPAVLDDPRSFTIRVTAGTVAMDGEGLSTLLNDHVFAYEGAPLKRLRLRTSGEHLVQKGVLHKGVDLPFEITATVSLEPDGRVRLHPVKTRILGINGEKLMRALGLHLDDLLDLRGARGVSVQKDDLLLEPTVILPPPAIAGRLASIRVEGTELVQEFQRLPDDTIFAGSARPDSAARNYVNFRGGRLRFGKLMMTDTNLEIVDADERDPFDLYLAKYHRQLVAGTSRTLPNLGLRVLMPDYRAVAGKRHGRAQAAP